MPSPPPVALTIAGSDSSGGAGIQADLKTFAAFRVFGASALTAVTAQNTVGVQAAVMLEPGLVARQIDSIADDLPIAATKSGMLGSAPVIDTVADAIERHRLLPFVLDPVMVAKSGDPLIDDAAVETLVRRLIPLAAVVTPNRHEAARLTGVTVTDRATAERAATKLCRDLGARACIIKTVREGDQSIDLFHDGRDLHAFAAPWRETNNTHGSGCAFSAAITAGLARGLPLKAAVEQTKRFIDTALKSDLALGRGTHPVNPLAWLDQ